MRREAGKGRREESQLRKSRNNKPEERRRVGGGTESRRKKAQRSLQPGPKGPLAHRAPVGNLSLEVNVGGHVTIKR